MLRRHRDKPAVAPIVDQYGYDFMKDRPLPTNHAGDDPDTAATKSVTAALVIGAIAAVVIFAYLVKIFLFNT
jgi:hypothetical protein